MERGLSSESNSVSGPLTPSECLSINFHMNPSDSLVWVLTDVSTMLLSTIRSLLFHCRKRLFNTFHLLSKTWFHSLLWFRWTQTKDEQAYQDEAEDYQDTEDNRIHFRDGSKEAFRFGLFDT